MIAFIVGVLVGAVIGVFGMCLAIAASDENNK